MCKLESHSSSFCSLQPSKSWASLRCHKWRLFCNGWETVTCRVSRTRPWSQALRCSFCGLGVAGIHTMEFWLCKYQSRYCRLGKSVSIGEKQKHRSALEHFEHLSLQSWLLKSAQLDSKLWMRSSHPIGGVTLLCISSTTSPASAVQASLQSGTILLEAECGILAGTQRRALLGLPPRVQP